ncbi:MAG: aminotransferase [Rhodospirillales bacterium]|nr:aminotransferase [Rhodospirillales bacterium]
MPDSAESRLAPNSSMARDIAYHLHPFTDLRRHGEKGPLVIVRGEGVRVFDEAGRGYIDTMSGLWCASLGFSQPRLAEAGRRQLETLPFYHSFTGRVPGVTVELAERLVGLAPEGLTRVFFCNSGSEANDTAVKIIRQVNNLRGKPEKKKIIARTGGYHGTTMVSASLTGLAASHGGFDLPLDGFLHTDRPSFYLDGEPGETEARFTTRLITSLEKLILEEGPETVAAFFAEPVMGAGGVLVPPAGYFQGVQDVLAKYDILFVADEVICGFHRTGNPWGCDTFGIRPDIVTAAKAISSGYAPIAAVLVGEEIYDILTGTTEAYGIFGHGFTYSGHPVSSAIALETLKLYDELEIGDHVREVAPFLQDGLRRFADHPLVGEVRGVGLVGAVQLIADRETRARFEPVNKVGYHLLDRAQAHGLIARCLGDAIAFSPPLIVTGDEIGRILTAFGKALDETHQWVVAGMPDV